MNDIHFRFASTVFAALPFATHTHRKAAKGFGFGFQQDETWMEKKTGQRKKHQEPSMLSNWVDAPLEIHKAFSLKIIKMRQAFKIKQRGNLIVLKRREKGSPVPHYFPHFLASYRWE